MSSQEIRVIKEAGKIYRVFKQPCFHSIGSLLITISRIEFTDVGDNFTYHSVGTIPVNEGAQKSIAFVLNEEIKVGTVLKVKSGMFSKFMVVTAITNDYLDFSNPYGSVLDARTVSLRVLQAQKGNGR